MACVRTALTGVVVLAAGKFSPMHEATLLRTWSDVLVLIATLMPFFLGIGYVVYQMNEYNLMLLRKGAPPLRPTPTSRHVLNHLAMPIRRPPSHAVRQSTRRSMAQDASSASWSSARTPGGPRIEATESVPSSCVEPWRGFNTCESSGRRRPRCAVARSS